MADQFKTLLDKVSSGKASVQEKLEFSNLLALQAQEEKTKGFADKLEKVKAFIEKEGLTVDEVISNLKTPPVAIFKWNGNVVYKGAKGRAPAWTADLKNQVSEAEATKLATNDDGKAWVKKLYNPSK